MRQSKELKLESIMKQKKQIEVIGHRDRKCKHSINERLCETCNSIKQLDRISADDVMSEMQTLNIQPMQTNREENEMQE